MSAKALQQLISLTGSSESLPVQLYKDGWPNKSRRFKQVLYNLYQWLKTRGTYVCIQGKDVPATRGHVQLTETANLQDIIAGACIVSQGQLASIATMTNLDVHSINQAYLADADVTVLFGKLNGKDVIAHVCVKEKDFTRYRDGYLLAQQALQSDALISYLPVLIAQQELASIKGFMLIQSRLRGRTVKAADLTEQQFKQYLHAAIKPLFALKRLERPADAKQLNDEMQLRLAEMVHNSELATFIHPILTAISVQQEQAKYCTLIAHGDYCLPNILFIDNENHKAVSGILDWERAIHYSSIGYDALYLVCITYAEWVNAEVTELFCQIWNGDIEPILHEQIEIIKQQFCLTQLDIHYLTLELLLAHLINKYHDFPNWSDTKKAYWLIEPGQAALNWLSQHSQNDSKVAS